MHKTTLYCARKVSTNRVPKLTMTRDPNLLSLSTTYVWGFNVVKQKLYSVACPHGFKGRAPKQNLAFDTKLIGRYLSSFLTYVWSLKVILKNCNICRANKVSHVESKKKLRMDWNRNTYMHTVLWNLNMHICISISIHSLFGHVFTIYHYTSMHTHIHVSTHVSDARAIDIMQIYFCRVVPRSTFFSNKTCLMCTICTI